MMEESLDYEKLGLLIEIAKMGGLDREVRLSSREFAERLGISRQSASRKLRELEEGELVERVVTPRGQYVRITRKGARALRKVWEELGRILGEEEGILVLEGRVVRGLGEGGYYVSLPMYKKQFVEKLGFDPYPGTLNVRLTPESIGARRRLEYMQGITIEGFTESGRKYGGAVCFKARINGRVWGALLLIERTHHGPDIVELIAPVHLRRELGLRDGDFVRIEVVP